MPPGPLPSTTRGFPTGPASTTLMTHPGQGFEGGSALVSFLVGVELEAAGVAGRELKDNDSPPGLLPSQSA
jgi:hypothetical protein